MQILLVGVIIIIVIVLCRWAGNYLKESANGTAIHVPKVPMPLPTSPLDPNGPALSSPRSSFNQPGMIVEYPEPRNVIFG